ncbi:MAG: ABC transporter ATP-binding protein [Candidatus Rifleibacteriota bacterium]
MINTTQTLYKLVNLKKIYRQRTVLNIQSLTLKVGKIYAVTGPNGTGKTSLLQILALVEYPDEGNVEIFDRRLIFKESFLQPMRKNLAMITQQPIFFNFSVKKNLSMPLKYRNYSSEKINELTEEMLRKVDMQAFADACGATLSGGEIQRLALARALISNPTVLLLDEPCTNIDNQHQTKIEELIVDFAQQKGKTVIFATHNQAQVNRLADHQLQLNPDLTFDLK